LGVITLYVSSNRLPSVAASCLKKMIPFSASSSKIQDNSLLAVFSNLVDSKHFKEPRPDLLTDPKKLGKIQQSDVHKLEVTLLGISTG
jgi:hypothetical protein